MTGGVVGAVGSVVVAVFLAATAFAVADTAVSRVEVVDAVATGPSVDGRLVEIRRRIEGALVYPPIARARRLEGVAHVRFVIRRDGAAEGVEVTQSSGHWVLDRAAVRGVQHAAPLPWVSGRLEVPVRFALGEKEAR